VSPWRCLLSSEENKFIVASILLVSTSGLLHAEPLYVTNHILLEVYQEASEKSPLLKSIPSGTRVESLQEQGAFTKVKLVDGIEGWVSSEHLISEAPVLVQYEKLQLQYKKNQETLKTVSASLTKRERDVQVLRDELSNAKNAMREMKKKGSVVIKADPEQAKKLQAAELSNKELLKQLDSLKEKSITAVEKNDAAAMLKYAEEENTALQARIALALSNLSGENAPTPEELAGIRPRFPLWYWLLMLVVLVVGIGGGIVWMDSQTRKRHGGYRL